MKRKLITALLIAAALTMAAGAALAADVFRFDSKTIDLFEGETAAIPLEREGAPAAEGTITYTAGNENAVSVAQDGTILALKKGKSTVKATLKTDKRTWTASLTVNVLRAVTNVTLNTTKLEVLDASDGSISGLLRQETEHPVIVIAAGKSVELKAACTPADASSTRVTFTSSDEGVFKAGQSSGRAMQAGECELTVASAQNPEIREVYHVLVTKPVTKITVDAAGGKRMVNVGGTLELQAEVLPSTASVKAVTWRSRNENIARVDENGVVTGVSKGTAVIEAKAADGSGKTGAASVTVTQQATSVTIRESSLMLAAGQLNTLHATVNPVNANDRGIVWSSSDEQVAVINASGQIRGVHRGECTIRAASKGTPSVYAEIPVQVIQRVTGITFTGSPVSMPINTTAQLTWQIQPADADVQEVVFSSSNKKVATVDENGLVTGHMRGSAVITAAATDGSNRKGTVRVTVTQPVEGVSIQYGVYHVQLDRSLNIKAIIRPSNANNQNVHFTIANEFIASVTDSRNIGRVRGRSTGTTVITGVTEDGGYSASAEIRVADFNRAIVVDDLYLERENIRLTLRNRSDFTVDRVYFTVETFDANGQPLVCNQDGESNFFEGAYRYELGPDERSEHYIFDFGKYVQPVEPISTVTVTITSWRDTEGYTRNIPEEDRPTQSYHRFIPTVLPDDGEGNG